MPNRDIVTIGGSTGALQVLDQVLAGLPGDLPASLFIVLHTGATSAGALSQILDRAGPLPCQTAVDGARFAPGHAYVAPPDRHLLLDDGRIALRRGPRENLSRPAIDPLFRSAAVGFGARVIGILLSGTLYDGASGLRAIKRCGGAAVVQDPADAFGSEMPQHAIDHVEIDHSVTAAEIAGLLARLVAEPAGASPAVPEDIRLEARIGAGELAGIATETRLGRLAPQSCPECGGNLWEMDDGQLLRYRCHVGHAYEAGVLLAEQSEAIDRAMWSAVRAHEERAAMLRRLASQARARDAAASAHRWDELAAEHDLHVDTIRRFLLRDLEPAPVPPGHE